MTANLISDIKIPAAPPVVRTSGGKRGATQPVVPCTYNRDASLLHATLNGGKAQHDHA